MNDRNLGSYRNQNQDEVLMSRVIKALKFEVYQNYFEF